MEVLNAQVGEVGQVCEQEISTQCDSLAHGPVVVEDKVMMFLGEGGKETKDVFPSMS